MKKILKKIVSFILSCGVSLSCASSFANVISEEEEKNFNTLYKTVLKIQKENYTNNDIFLYCNLFIHKLLNLKTYIRNTNIKLNNLNQVTSCQISALPQPSLEYANTLLLKIQNKYSNDEDLFEFFNLLIFNLSRISQLLYE